MTSLRGKQRQKLCLMPAEQSNDRLYMEVDILYTSGLLVPNFNVEVLLDTVDVLPVHQGAVSSLVVDELAGEWVGPVFVPVYGESPSPSCNERYCSLLHSHWSRLIKPRLSLVESFIVMLRQCLLCHKEPVRRI